QVGIWPIADTVAPMQSSKNRKSGNMMLKPATINAERYKELMIDKVIPAIKPRCLEHQVTRSSCSRMVQSRTRGEGSWRQFRQRRGTASSWKPSLPTHLTSTHLNESRRACSQSLGKSLALRVIIATSCPIWARRISVGQANFRSTGGSMRKNTVSE
ncbi:unnamed protein product, partial [Discosporangium mesarthrocarpum]